jgi:hypothetical protein
MIFDDEVRRTALTSEASIDAMKEPLAAGKKANGSV